MYGIIYLLISHKNEPNVGKRPLQVLLYLPYISLLF